MFLAAVANLESKKEWINELNVFPVPDGDTGTNMTLTTISAAKEVLAVEEPTMEKLSKAISSGSLRGARGNSGVILSQLFRGMTKVIKTHDELDIPIITEALQKATETAYKAVMKPKEGTILTVARGISDKAKEICDTTTDLASFIEELIAEGDRVLDSTPDLLPVLKQAGVVDSGGQGLMQVLKGAYEGFCGKEADLNFDESGSRQAAKEEAPAASYSYQTEFIVETAGNLSSATEKEIRDYLTSIGESVVCVAADNMLKIRLRTADPGLALQKCLSFGRITRVKVENPMEITRTTEAKPEEQNKADEGAPENTKQENEEPVPGEDSWKDYGFISVSSGSGISGIFEGLGVDYLIEGGQTMNPSTDDMLNAIRHVPARDIFILPNNSNIVMAANQAKALTKDKTIHVIPTKTIPQGISAIISFAPEKSMQENEDDMLEGIKAVKTGQVTYAVRDTMIDDIEIHKGDYIGLGDKGMLASGTDLSDVSYEALKKMIDSDSELIGIYFGCDVTEEDAETLAARVREDYPDLDVEVNAGNQPIYYYILSVE